MADLLDATLLTHANSLPSRFTGLQKLSQLLLKDLQALCAGSVGHAEDRSPKVEGIRDVGAGAEEDEHDEIERVSQD